MQNKFFGRIVSDESKCCNVSGMASVISSECFCMYGNADVLSLEDTQIVLCGSITHSYAEDYPLGNDDLKSVADLYFRFGNDFYEKIDGLFVIFIFDNAAKELHIYNCRNSASLVYYAQKKDGFYFASDMDILIECSGMDRVHDPTVMNDFLLTGFLKTDKMPLAGVNRLFPTCRLDLRRDGEVRISDHWHSDYIFNRHPVKDKASAVSSYIDIFRESVRGYIRGRDHSRIGCLLSGGGDTSFVYALASDVCDVPIHTFTGTIKGDPNTEVPKAARVTSAYNGIHHVVELTPQSLDYIPEMIRACGEPVCGSSLPIFLCAKESAKYSDVVLGGDPGDSLWDEYYPVAAWHSIIKHFPFGLRKLMHKVSVFMRSVCDYERFWELEHVLRLFAEKEMYSDFFTRLCTYRHFSTDMLQDLLGIEGNVKLPEPVIKRAFTAGDFNDALVEQKMLYGVYTYMLSNTELSFRHHGIDFIPPYMNRDLVRFINKLPRKWLNSGNLIQMLSNKAQKRLIHTEALNRLYPAGVLESNKQGFNIAFNLLFDGREDLLQNLFTALKKRGSFNHSLLERIFDEFPKQRLKQTETCQLQNHGYRVYALLTFEVWMREFVDNLRSEKGLPDLIPLDEYLLL